MRVQRNVVTLLVALVFAIAGLTCGIHSLLTKQVFAAEGMGLWSLNKPVKPAVHLAGPNLYTVLPIAPCLVQVAA